MSSNIRVSKVCQHCGKQFIAKTTVTKYCGDNCAKKAYKKRKREEKIQMADKAPSDLKTYYENEIGTKEYLSIKEVCGLLGMSRMTVYRNIKYGRIPALKFKGRVIISKKRLERIFI
ncbi:excisionase family DNA binding protein [Roseivirga pacifica]|uniref:DNA binding domain-containing protein, excisionase family n=1 Tax=Roseivirga pacifica TaxID=1267423 RepID=A0A1I0QHU8_9BACT|nr:helix-turn-helix domain-containing protein [Roseivirga pacifica]RKQ42916.1 excisionase family DNA binding protein [Roseivirga pacifica]SEW26447.1 DNA binding domain-containing protein, excisionase family [Roseivirga pacifica]